jgi:hypothetical protein
MKIKVHRIHAYLGYNIIGNQKQFMCIALLIKEMWGKSMSVIDRTHCINKAILCSVKKFLTALKDKLKQM